MADQTGIGGWLDALEARLSRLEELVGRPEQPPILGLCQQMAAMQSAYTNLKITVKEELLQTVEEKLGSVSDKVSCLTDTVDFRLENLKTDLKLVKKAVACSGAEGAAVASKVRVLDHKPFGGERSAKELENFLWDMEAYFRRQRCPSQACI
ncbi:UNVERIFIED_CONTAM: hypothetical protein Sradi_6247800 [Sesamum radiatum]|uniref:Uncharacterized protein n=1 Tax=Sesamum radiatum TaxID=300843 RepID=A0AAW2KAB6_SESRA